MILCSEYKQICQWDPFTLMACRFDKTFWCHWVGQNSDYFFSCVTFCIQLEILGSVIQQNFNKKNLLFDLLQHAKMFSDAIDSNKLSHLQFQNSTWKRLMRPAKFLPWWKGTNCLDYKWVSNICNLCPRFKKIIMSVTGISFRCLQDNISF